MSWVTGWDLKQVLTSNEPLKQEVEKWPLLMLAMVVFVNADAAPRPSGNTSIVWSS